MANDHKFWKCIEAHFSLKVPKYIKNIFLYYGYSYAMVVKAVEFNDKSISKLEEFTRSLLPLLPKDSDNKDFFYIYHEQQWNFKFVEGHKILIEEIIDYVKATIEEKGIEDGLTFFNKPDTISGKERRRDRRSRENGKKTEEAEPLQIPLGNTNVL